MQLHLEEREMEKRSDVDRSFDQKSGDRSEHVGSTEYEAAVATLDRGEFHTITLEEPAEITADHPVLVAQFAHGQEFDNTLAAAVDSIFQASKSG